MKATAVSVRLRIYLCALKYTNRFLLGYSTTSKAYKVWNLASGTLEEVHDVEFDGTKGSQEENENLEDV